MQAGNPAALLRTFLAHGRLEEAAELALDILDNQKKQVSRREAHQLAVSFSRLLIHLDDPVILVLCLRRHAIFILKCSSAFAVLLQDFH